MCLELNDICFLILLHFITYFYFFICEVAQLCLNLCDPMDCNLPGSSVHRIGLSRQEYWSRLAFPFPGDFLVY